MAKRIAKFTHGPERTKKGLNELVDSANDHESRLSQIEGKKGNIVTTITMVDGFAVYVERAGNILGPVP